MTNTDDQQLPSRVGARPVSDAGDADGASAAVNASTEPATEKVRWYRKEYGAGRLVKPEVVKEFARQLSSFLEAGIPLADALTIVAAETASEDMQTVVTEMRASVMRGASFVDACNAHPKVFPAYFRATVKSSAYTGNLDEVLSQLATSLERDIAARRQVKSALTYPIIVLCVAAISIVAMAVFVLPKFSGLYKKLGAKLPLPTRMLLGFTDFVSSYWPFILVTLVGGTIAGYALFGTESSKPRRDRTLLKLPVLGPLTHLVAVERFCRVLSSLVKSGVPLPEAIEVSADSTNNDVFQTKLAEVRRTLMRGGGLSGPIEATEIFPIAARQMIDVGERTGMLGVQLGKAASYYEREVSFHIKKATDIFEPMVILVVGSLVGFVAVAQVAAMYSIFSQIK